MSTLHQGLVYAIYDPRRRMYAYSSDRWQDEIRFATLYPTRRAAEQAQKRLNIDPGCIVVGANIAVPDYRQAELESIPAGQAPTPVNNGQVTIASPPPAPPPAPAGKALAPPPATSKSKSG